MKSQKIRITKEFTFEMAHALDCHDGACKNIHGHSYVLSVTIAGVPVDDDSRSDSGMVMDFGDLKKIVKDKIISVFDHALVLNSSTKNQFKNFQQNFTKILWVDYHPTSENLLVDFVDRIKPELFENIELHHLKLRETASCFAEWYASDNE